MALANRTAQKMTKGMQEALATPEHTSRRPRIGHSSMLTSIVEMNNSRLENQIGRDLAKPRREP